MLHSILLRRVIERVSGRIDKCLVILEWQTWNPRANCKLNYHEEPEEHESVVNKKKGPELVSVFWASSYNLTRHEDDSRKCH